MTFVLFLVISSASKVFPTIPVGLASGLAILLTSLFNFSAQYAFTFRSKQSLQRSGTRYVLLVNFNAVWGGFLASYLINTHGLDSLIANVICAFAITVFSYPAMRFLVM